MPKSQKPKKIMTPVKKAALKQKIADKKKPILLKSVQPKAPSVTEFIGGFRAQFGQFERIAQTIDGGLAALAQEVMLRSAWLWAQGDDMTREKFAQVSGEIFDQCVKAIEDHKAKQTGV